MTKPPRMPNSGGSWNVGLAIIIVMIALLALGVPGLIAIVSMIVDLIHLSLEAAAVHAATGAACIAVLLIVLGLLNYFTIEKQRERLRSFYKHVEWCAQMALNEGSMDNMFYVIVMEDVAIARQYHGEPLNAVYRLKTANLWKDRPAELGANESK